MTPERTTPRNPHRTASLTSTRTRRLAVAGLATAGLISGGAVVANAASASDGRAASTAASAAAASSSSAAPKAPARGAHRPHIDGTITAKSGDTVTVKDLDGFTREIVVSSSTTYKLSGKASSSSALVVGRFVHADGKVDSNGTSLDASTVMIMTSAPKPGTGPAGLPKPGGRGPGKGGPGKHAPGKGGKPSGTPSPRPTSS